MLVTQFSTILLRGFCAKMVFTWRTVSSSPYVSISLELLHSKWTMSWRIEGKWKTNQLMKSTGKRQEREITTRKMLFCRDLSFISWEFPRKPMNVGTVERAITRPDLKTFPFHWWITNRFLFDCSWTRRKLTVFGQASGWSSITMKS